MVSSSATIRLVEMSNQDHNVKCDFYHLGLFLFLQPRPPDVGRCGSIEIMLIGGYVRQHHTALVLPKHLSIVYIQLSGIAN